MRRYDQHQSIVIVYKQCTVFIALWYKSCEHYEQYYVLLFSVSSLICLSDDVL